METKKMTLANVQGKLSRAEMKIVMAGDATLDGEDGSGKCTHECRSDDDCGLDCPKCKQGGTAKFCSLS